MCAILLTKMYTFSNNLFSWVGEGCVLGGGGGCVLGGGVGGVRLFRTFGKI